VKKIVLLFISVTLLALTSCSQKPSENESDYTVFLNMLADSNIQYTEEDTDTSSFLSVTRKPILIGDDIISIYEYDSNKDMEKDSTYIDKGGSSISYPGKEVEISWVSQPHFFKKGTLIINYVGENEQILELLNKNYGAEFAGYGYINK